MYGCGTYKLKIETYEIFKSLWARRKQGQNGGGTGVLFKDLPVVEERWALGGCVTFVGWTLSVLFRFPKQYKK